MNKLAIMYLIPVVTLLMLLVVVPAATCQNVATFEKRLTEFTLDNGLKFLVLERHGAPVVTCHTHVNVGTASEVKGITGLAHLLEHMAFKGTKTIGTRDYEAEVKLMAKMDDLSQTIKYEQRKRKGANQWFLEELSRKFKEAQRDAQELIVHDEFVEIFRRAGGVGLNAETTCDYTTYHVSLPSNKLELWMLMESDRFLNPALREFYVEKQVVMEERRKRVENWALGRLGEEFLATAYKAHPYGEPTVGHMSDLKTLTRVEAREFFNKYYVAGNLTIAIVGDVNPSHVKELAEIYFGRLPTSPPLDPVETVEPPQAAERRVTIVDPAQPIIFIGYHMPDINHLDYMVFNAIFDIVSVGRTSRLHKVLVKEKKIAMRALCLQGRPGKKYPGLFIFYAVPAKGHTNEECEKAIYAEIRRLKSELVSAGELEKAKTRTRAKLIRQLSANAGIARQLSYYQVITGNWRNLFGEFDQIGRVTADGIQRVATSYFTTENRTVGIIKTASR